MEKYDKAIDILVYLRAKMSKRLLFQKGLVGEIHVQLVLNLYEKGVLKNFVVFRGKHLMSATLLKRDCHIGAFP